MANSNPRQWMWDEALDMLSRAERLHRQLFQPAAGPQRPPAWEPPVDVLETEGEVVIIAAVPGLRDQSVLVALDGPFVIIAGERAPPEELRTAVIHRLELPQGRFERRVALPAGRYDKIQYRTEHGCLVVRLRKLPRG